MVILVCDVQGVILCYFVPHGETVNVQYYAAYLQNHLRRAVRRKLPQMQNFVILHDNATPHKAICTRDLLRCWRWEVLEHPQFESSVAWAKFRTRDGIVVAVRRLFMTNFSHGEADGICRLPHRWQRTIDSLGGYFEGL